MIFLHSEKISGRDASVSKKDSDPSAPYDGYEESDDTEEKARTIRLEKKR